MIEIVFFGLIFIINNAIIYFHFVIYKQETYDLKILFFCFSQIIFLSKDCFCCCKDNLRCLNKIYIKTKLFFVLKFKNSGNASLHFFLKGSYYAFSLN